MNWLIVTHRQFSKLKMFFSLRPFYLVNDVYWTLSTTLRDTPCTTCWTITTYPSEYNPMYWQRYLSFNFCDCASWLLFVFVFFIIFWQSACLFSRLMSFYFKINSCYLLPFYLPQFLILKNNQYIKTEQDWVEY